MQSACNQGNSGAHDDTPLMSHHGGVDWGTEMLFEGRQFSGSAKRPPGSCGCSSCGGDPGRPRTTFDGADPIRLMAEVSPPDMEQLRQETARLLAGFLPSLDAELPGPFADLARRAQKGMAAPESDFWAQVREGQSLRSETSSHATSESVRVYACSRGHPMPRFKRAHELSDGRKPASVSSAEGSVHSRPSGHTACGCASSVDSACTRCEGIGEGAHWAEWAPGEHIPHELERERFPGSDGFFFYIREGAFDMTFSPSYTVPVGSVKKAATLGYVWNRFLFDPHTLSRTDIQEMIVEWDLTWATRPTGNFWTDPMLQTLIYAIKLLDTYRGFIPDVDENCCGAQTSAAERLDSGTFWVRVADVGYDDSGTAYDMTYSVELSASCGDRCLDVPISASLAPDGRAMICRNGADDCDIVTIFYGQLAAHAMIADQFLYLAHVAYGYADWLTSNFPGLTDKITDYRSQAKLLGKLALSAITTVARTLLHEQIHRQTLDEGWTEYSRGATAHCDFGCCMQRIAGKFGCSVHAYLGLYAADANDTGIDVDLLGNKVRYRSGCDTVSWTGGCGMTSLGSEGDETAWSQAGTWSSGTCTTSTSYGC